MTQHYRKTFCNFTRPKFYDRKNPDVLNFVQIFEFLRHEL